MTHSTIGDGETFPDAAQLAHGTTEAPATHDVQRLKILSEAAENRRRAIPTMSRVSQAAAHQVMAMRELMRFTSERLSLLETMYHQRCGDAEGWAR